MTYYTPHDYQKYAINFIETHPQAAILLGMGLGKTIITLTALNNLIYNHYKTRYALIIAPLRVARDTWPTEIQKWDHLKHLSYAACVGTPTQRLIAIKKQADLTIINRENLPWLVKQLGNTWPYDTVIIDELSSFKNHKSQRFKALKSRRPYIDRIVGLTGTPAPNGLGDLWAPMKLLDDGQRLGKTLTCFRSAYFDPDKRNGHQIFSWKLKPGAEQAIYNQIADTTISMRTTDYLQLPGLTITDHQVSLVGKQKTIYNKLKKEMIATIDSENIVADSAATLSGKLRQLASGAIYTDDKETIHVHDQKLEALEDIVEAANGQSVLVGYWFKHELQSLQERFPDGRVLSSSEDIADWCKGEVQLAFIHPASAGHGLNLQSGGHILVWFTVPWSLELYEQTNARLFRQGQTEPVSIIRIIAEKTIDEQVIKALERKDMTQSALVDAVKAQFELEEL
ncbi:SNF2-related protein [Corynebacterium kutscheri]|uniref:SNF2-related protein n=1 Tax=Corynebacterium kutscheri TaxID=35755 RepID=UPI0037C18F3E